MKFSLSLTNFCKGIATLLLLWHHLFYLNPEYGSLVHKSAFHSRVCVTLFVILSGYGLTVSFMKHPLPWIDWYKNRFAKLYLNYWLIIIIFVPISWLVFGNSIDKMFSGSYIWLKFVSQILGGHMYWGGYGFNPTWWFISAILSLYLIFPVIYRIICDRCDNFKTGIGEKSGGVLLHMYFYALFFAAAEKKFHSSLRNTFCFRVYICLQKYI